MTTEEVYIRSFVTAGAIAPVVAFLVILTGLLLRKNLGNSGLGIIGGLALALAWIGAHIAMRGSEAWADLVRGGNGWKRFVWPIEVIDRFPIFVLIALAGGSIGGAITDRKGPRWNAARWTARILTMGAIARLVLGPYPWPLVALSACVAGASALGALWWWAMERSNTPKHAPLLPATIAVVSIGFGILMLMRYGVTLGLVSICGAPACAVLTLAATRDPRLVAGPALCAVAAGGWVALVTSALVYCDWWPLTTTILACAAPLAAGLISEPRCSKRPAWNRWTIQLGTAAVLMGIGVAVVHWIDHRLVQNWP